MQLQQPNNLGEIYLSPLREDALQLLNPVGDRAPASWFAAGALMVGFGLGWAGSSSWYGSPTILASNPINPKRYDLSSARDEVGG